MHRQALIGRAVLVLLVRAPRQAPALSYQLPVLSLAEAPVTPPFGPLACSGKLLTGATASMVGAICSTIWRPARSLLLRLLVP